MANYRNISMAFWTDSKVEDDFTPEDKYIYLWCLTNPHTNLCGCYEISIKQISHETGYTADSINQVLKRLDASHNVIRYSASTKELLILNWFRYNWSQSEKLNKPLLNEIRNVKCDRFREYLADRYNDRESVAVQYEYGADKSLDASRVDELPSSPKAVVESPPPEKKVRHKRGEYGWVRLTDAEYERLLNDLGVEELQRCISYIEESAQSNHNKNGWKDWNMVIRRCHRDGWGLSRYATARNTSRGAMEDLQALHRQFEEEG